MSSIVEQLIQLEEKANLGAPVLLPDLRNDFPGMSKDRFDGEILALFRSGRYLLFKYEKSDGLTDHDKEMMVPDGVGGYFVGIMPRPDKGLIPAGRRKRQQASVPMKEVQLKSTCKVPKWINDWLKNAENPCELVTAALIEKYHLIPPSP